MRLHVARQPIYDQAGKIFGYELLYRSGENQISSEGMPDGDMATCSVLSAALMTFGLEQLTDGCLGFVNFTKGLLMGSILELLDPKSFIVEILEDIEVDNMFVQCIRNWHELGFCFAIDDYIGEEKYAPLMPYVDIIKVDFLLLEPARRSEVARRLLAQGKKLLAEKVETKQEYEQACIDGYTLFQGYYFNRPILMSSDTTEVQSTTCVRIYNELNKPVVDFDQVGRIVSSDVNLSYRLLRQMSSLHYYRGNKITSIGSALVRMGVVNLRNWISLVFLGGLSKESNLEQVRIALVRGVFAEQSAVRLGMASLKSDAFFTGIFSMLTTIVEQSMEELLISLPISDHVKQALLYHRGILHELLKFIISYQEGEWEYAFAFIESTGIDQDAVAEDFKLAVQYSDAAFACQ